MKSGPYINEFIVLAMLEGDREWYGSALTKEINIHLGFGPDEGFAPTAFYPILTRLVRLKLVKPRVGEAPPGGGNRRIYVKITPKGKTVLDEWRKLLVPFIQPMGMLK